MFTMDSVPVRREDSLAWNEIDGQVVILEMNEERSFHELNPSASWLWQALGESTITDLILDFADHFGIPEARAAGDVTAFLAELYARDLIAARQVNA